MHHAHGRKTLKMFVKMRTRGRAYGHIINLAGRHALSRYHKNIALLVLITDLYKRLNRLLLGK